MPETLIDAFKHLNRKERFFLVGWALGNSDFCLGDDFKHTLSTEIQEEVPPDAFVAMDFHIDWIHGAVIWSAGPDAALYPRDLAAMKANQEDVDLLVAFEAGGLTRLVMIEAKCETGWTNKQLTSKLIHLQAVLEKPIAQGIVRPSFLIASPKKPVHLQVTDWPRWALRDNEPHWVELPMPGRRWRMTRCDDAGKSSASGLFWKMTKKL